MRNRILIFFALIVFFSYYLYAVPAKPSPIVVKQSDGTQLMMVLKGDEYFSFCQTLDGYLILRNKNNVFEYANISESGEIKTTGIKVKDIAERSIDEREYVKSLDKNRIYAKILKDKNYTDSIYSSNNQINKSSAVSTSFLSTPFSSKSVALQSVHSASLGIAVTCAENQKSL